MIGSSSMYTPPTDKEIGAMTGRATATWYDVRGALELVGGDNTVMDVDLGHLAGVHVLPGESITMMLPVRISA